MNRTIRGDKVTIEIHQFKTIYNWMGVDYSGFHQLAAAMRFYLDDLNGEDIDAIELDLAKLELRELTRLYAIATRERTASELICDLSDMGVEAQSIRIPCAGENCGEVSIEELDHYLPIADLASQADYACEFEDGLCVDCYQTKEREDAEEEIARAQFEAREDIW